LGAASELQNSLKWNFAVNAPAAAGLMAAGLPIIQMIFQHGHFQLNDSKQTASALFWYSVGLPGYSLVKVMVPVFYALGTTRIPVTVSFVSVLLNALINHLFLNVFHFPFWALVFATSATATINAVVLGFYLHALLPGSIGKPLLKTVTVHLLISSALGAAAMAAVALVAQTEPFFTAHIAIKWAANFLFWSSQVGASMLAAALVVLVAGKIFKISEVALLLDFLEKRVLRRFIKK
jgi:peptidoglycan biosynthesis protein MviN/MurJ (putative lipid II flippase)